MEFLKYVKYDCNIMVYLIVYNNINKSRTNVENQNS